MLRQMGHSIEDLSQNPLDASSRFGFETATLPRSLSLNSSINLTLTINFRFEAGVTLNADNFPRNGLSQSAVEARRTVTPAPPDPAKQPSTESLTQVLPPEGSAVRESETGPQPEIRLHKSFVFAEFHKKLSNLETLLIEVFAGENLVFTLETEQQVGQLRVFMRECSHKQSDEKLKRAIEDMTLSSYQKVLTSSAQEIRRHRLNDSIRGSLTVLCKFSRQTKDSLVSPQEFKLFKKNRFSEQNLRDECMRNRNLKNRLIKHLRDPRFRVFCGKKLARQIGMYAARWIQLYAATGKWLARFSLFPAEIDQTIEFLAEMEKC